MIVGGPPKGVVGVIIGPKGDVWAEASDFDLSGYGGFTLAQAQRIRCERRLRIEFFRRACAAPVAAAIGEYEASNLLRKMPEFTERYIEIGHEPEAAQ